MDAIGIDELIGYICESPKDTIFGYVPKLSNEYGIGLPPKQGEDPFVTWIKKFIKTIELPEEYKQSAVDRPEEFIDLLLARYDAIIITVLNGHVDVYSRRRHAKKVPKEFLDKVDQMLDIWPDTNVGWFQSVNSNPVATLAAEPIYGLEPDEVSDEQVRHKMSKALGMHGKSELRRKFWGAGGYDPSTAPDIVDKLLQ